MGPIPYDLSITVISIIAAGFIALGVFYPWLSSQFGFEEGGAGQRFLSILLGVMLLALLWIYQLAKVSMTEP